MSDLYRIGAAEGRGATARTAASAGRRCTGINLGETFDIGTDTRSPVDDRDYKVPFAFTGKVVAVDIKLGPPQLQAPDTSGQHASAAP